jgi:lipopolysaccharide/colanic/teichoic acid biosynthesis glycosyltransferase
VKRAIDIAAALLGIVVSLPLMVLVALVVLFTMGRPVLFLQERAGWHGRTFRMYKLRTMTLDRDAMGTLLPDADRLTPTGTFIRRTSLDEVPQLLNVLRGEMSLVGPRPLLPEYLPRYNAYQARRHEVRPGMTGWAQVNGRNTLEWADRLAMDVWYVENRSFRLDMKILFMTISRVFSREGVSAEGHATVSEFKGEHLP